MSHWKQKKTTPGISSSFMHTSQKKEPEQAGSSSSKRKPTQSLAPIALEVSSPGARKFMGPNRVSARLGIPSSDLIDVDTHNAIKEEARAFLTQEMVKDKGQVKSLKVLAIKRNAIVDNFVKGLSSGPVLKKSRRFFGVIEDDSDDYETILRGFPRKTSVEDAANVVARVVQRAVKGDLAPEVLKCARLALKTMSTTPDIAALPGLLDTMYSSRNTFEFAPLSLFTGSLRAVIKMRSLITEPLDAERIIKVIADSCLSALRSDNQKIAQIPIRYSRVGLQFMETFEKAVISRNSPDDDAAAADTATTAALMLGVSLNLAPNSADAIAAAIVPFFEACLLRCPSAMWRTVLAPDVSSDLDAISHTASALYVAKWVVSDESDKKRTNWLQARRNAPIPVLLALLDLLGNHAQVLLRSSPESSTSTYAELIFSSFWDVSPLVLNESMMVEFLSRTSAFASESLAALCSNRLGPSSEVKRYSNAKSDKDVGISDATPAGDFNFAALQCSSRTEDGQITEPKQVEIPNHLEKHCNKARRILKGAGLKGKLENKTKSWYDKHPWAVDIRDSQMRRPGEKGYDKTTLYVPPEEYLKNGLSPFAQQYWKIKSENNDIIIIIKKGKFYEVFDRDADICVKELGLSYVNNNDGRRSCGFYSSEFDESVDQLLELNYKVGFVNEIETKEERDKRTASSKSYNICRRDLVWIRTKGTATNDSMLRDCHTRYVISLVESGCNDEAELDESVEVAMCYVDVAGGSINIRQFKDDFRRTITERILTELRPQEIIIDETSLSLRVRKIVRFLAKRTSADIIDTLPEAFDPITERVLDTYIKQDELKARLKEYIESNQLGAQAYGAMKMYLTSLKIDKGVLSLENYDLEPKIISSLSNSTNVDDDAMQIEEEGEVTAVGNTHPKFTLAGFSNTVHMDAATLNSLELVANANDGTEKGSLLSFLDKASTPAGKRLLRKWTAAPLVCTEEINYRLQAVTTLLHLEKNLGSIGFSNLSDKLRGKCDLERALSRLHKQATVADTAVIYEHVHMKRVKFFFQVLHTVKSILEAVEDIRVGLEDYCTDTEFEFERLEWLVRKEGGAIPSDAMEKLNYFFVAFAEKSCIIEPTKGTAPYYDRKEIEHKELEKALGDELEYWKAELRCSSIKFFHRGQEPYQLEIPKNVIGSTRPREFEWVSCTKKVERFYTPKLKGLIKEKLLAEEELNVAKKNVIREFVAKFDNHYETWSAVMKTATELDALMGLTRTSLGDEIGPMCRPDVLPNDYPYPVFEATELRHPVLSSALSNFVTNDVILGDDKNPIVVVLTGMNAGGKSTLSRQVAVCALLAQIGCYVPASTFKIRPFQNVFVRMGAGDAIARGMSTFMVEMEEVSNILNNASSHSLVIADEVGRGTSIHDGYAIAYATLHYLVKHSKCLCIFSTHYHMLGKEIASEVSEADRKNIGVYEMAAVMDEQRKEIIFLHKFQEGISMSSRGICCARLAGLPAEVADAAEVAAEEFERYLSKNKIHDACRR